MNNDTPYYKIWQDAYESLNSAQREAVDTIDGPVMTIAGPGTGKTQLLAARIGNILLKTDAAPYNILCLTFTDAGVTAMRDRLSKFIGPEAYNVGIYTFHAFCNMVIKENPSIFGEYRQLESLSEIEEVEVYREIIDAFDDENPLKRLKGKIYFDKDKIKNLIALMKQEEWTHETFVNALAEFDKIMDDEVLRPEKYTYKQTRANYKKGDKKEKEINEDREKIVKTVAGSACLAPYKKLLDAKDRMDFNDMILMVLDKFRTNDNLLAKYQERYQYMLVDEYQDTNGAQNNLIFMLADYWDDPNLFIVGDDDQSIYAFQGANMKSIYQFKEKYNPKEVVLTQNYRSTQEILDSATKLISNNQDRLTKVYPHISKVLVESRRTKHPNPLKPQILSFDNEAAEEIGILNMMENLHKEGVPYSDMAVIYKQHRFVDNMINYLMLLNIPINIKRRVNVLEENEVQKLINILKYVDLEARKPNSANDLLFQILHYDYLGIKPVEIAKINLYINSQYQQSANEDDENEAHIKVLWRQVISDEALLRSINIQSVDQVIKVSNLIESWIGSIHNVTIQVLMQMIITQSGLLHKLMSHEDQSFLLQVVNTFFDFVKEETAKIRNYSIRDLIKTIEIMEEEKIKLPATRIISNNMGINFVTAHSAKGLEYKHVFIIKANETFLEKSRSGNNDFTLPFTLTKTNSENDIEDDRRLFFVSMTRAIDNLYISHHREDAKGKKLTVSKFVTEIKSPNEESQEVIIEPMVVQSYKMELMRYKRGIASLIDHDLIDRLLLNFKLSVTHLNKYIRCKTAYYFENILRVPLARNASMGFGSVVHYAFEHFFLDINKSNPRSYSSDKKFIAFFEEGMEKYRSHFTSKEFDDYTKYGTKLIKEYYETYQDEFLTPRSYEIEYDIRDVEHRGVPISGKLDRVDIYDDTVKVIDFKTGVTDRAKKIAKPKDTNLDGGEYWRQIIFYRILIDADRRQNWTMRQGVMDFLEKESGKDKLQRQTYDISGEEIQIVSDQLVEAWAGIKAHDFTPGCGEDDCQWCNFVQKHMPVTHLESDNDEMDKE